MSTKEGNLKESYIKLERTHAETDLKTIIDCLEYHASTIPDKEAVVFVASNYSREAVTWSRLFAKARETAKALISLGVKKGEVIAVNVRNCPEWLYIVIGAMMTGAIAVSISFTYTDGSDLIAIMEKLRNCCLLVLDPGVAGANWNIVKKFIKTQNGKGRVRSDKMPYLRYLITHKDEDYAEMQNNLHLVDFLEQLNDDIQLPKVEEDDIAFLFQTSGSTGVPKLVAHTHRAIRVCQQVATEAVAADKSIAYNDRPFAWIGGFPLTLISGIKRVTVSGFCSPPEDRAAFVIEVAKREKCSSVSVLPQMVHEFIRRQDELPFDWQISALATGGQPLSRSIAKCLGKITPAIVSAYGATEFQIAAIAFAIKEEQFEENCCGNLFQGPEIEMKVVDNDEKVVPINTYGEVYFRGDSVFKEYFHDEEKTAAVKTPEGWFKTNDIGKLNEKGVLYIQGRKSSTIISGGMNVSPDILERILESYPGLEAAVIVPVPDDVYYQVLCACVRLQPGSDVTEQQLRKFLEEYYNDKPGLFTVIPKFYLFQSQFPEVFTGKVSRKDLTDLASRTFGKEH
ncbi:medium-chain acyl-CoA ligase ACSF2, mitochondrial-like [Mercenaria mercenaria]|uniref:medium-chain acyl-CoA ligase ACSF2, mitochondrial-like n=1 Tax=Mercenaria mercenaria TaxID=6596 RepID=UPI00234F538D|nr:medium-chain acyl-CoA ligase ACSF2, mitochondrial-like [Mercenaria mercenaria]